jgi:RNA polymerase sigma factor (TIGR02999 family)
MKTGARNGARGGYNVAVLNQVTQILDQIQRGESGATEELLPLIYHELRELAAAKVARERSAQRQDATSLVHEAYLRLVGDGEQPHWNSRGHFFAAAAEAMRRILVDKARRRHRLKRGGDRKRVDLDEDCVAYNASPSRDLVELDIALDRLALEDPEEAQVVKLRYFAGLSLDECAAALGISLATAKRRWAYARAWLYEALSDARKS